MVPGEKIAISSRRHHCFVFYLHIADVDESRLKLLEIKVDVDEIFAILPGFRHNELEVLLIPTFTNPANIGKFFRFHTDGLSPKYDVIAVDIFMNERVKGSNFFIFEFEKTFGINIAIISIEVETVDFFILIQRLTYQA